MEVIGMGTTMKAIVCRGPHKYALEEIPIRSVGKGDVLIKVEGCGICAGDVKAYAGAAMFWGDDTQPAWMTAPVIPGHEFVGRIAEISSEAKAKRGLNVGDRVVVEQIVPCGECRFCKSGAYWMCHNGHDIVGFKSHLNGGMAEYMLAPEKSLVYKVPDTLTVEEGVMVEPLACAIHAVERAEIGLKDVVVIAGLGALGLCMIQVARLQSPAKLIAVDLNSKRLALAESLGADIALNPAEADVVAEVNKLTDGYGCDKYIEATGHPSGVVQGLQMIRKLGLMVEFSVFDQPTSVDWSIIGDRKEITINGAHLSPYTFPVAIDFLRTGKVRVSEIVTHSFPLEKWEEGFELVKDAKDSIKVILKP
jgi:2-desacetyl-2-hydroxyethyl bacteriochlorophyllide A dehydrogenase